MYEKFTDRARLVMALAAEIASQRGHAQIESDDVLFGMIREGHGVAGNVLRNIGVDHTRFDADIAPRQSDREREPPVEYDHDLSSIASQLLDNAFQEAKELNHNYVGTEHLLLGLCRTPNSAGSEALDKLDIQLDRIYKEVVSLLGVGLVDRQRDYS